MEESGHFVSELANLHFSSSHLYSFSYHLVLAETIKHPCRIIQNSEGR